MNRWERLSFSAWLSLSAHLVAGLAMLLLLGRGLQTNHDLADRLAFLYMHRVQWTCSWLTWTMAGVSILYFYLCYLKAHEIPRARLVLALALLAIAFDWTAQGIEVFVLPGLAFRGAVATFLLLDRKAVLLTGGLANGLYTVATAMLIWPTKDAYPRWTVNAGWGVVFFGAALSAAAVADSTGGLFWSNAGLVPCLGLWLAGTALSSRRPET